MDITYRFVASGQQDVEKAFAGIEARAKASKKATDDAGRSAARGGAGSGGGGAGGNQAARLAARVAADQERAAKRETSIAERAAIAKMRSAERAQRHVAGIRDRHFRDEQRREEKHASDSIRRLERAAKEGARKEAAAKDRARKESDDRRQRTVGTLKDMAGGALLGGVATTAAVIGSAAREAMQLQEAANRISISGRKPGEEARSADKLRRGFERTAINNQGVASEDVAAGVGGFQALTGETNFALKLQDTFAKAAQASGASVKEIAEAAASGFMHFGINTQEDMQQYLASTHFQGKAGAIEFGDAAAMYQRLAAAGAGAGIGKGVEGVKSVGGLLQTFRGGTGNREQATTAVENLFRVLKEKQSNFAKWGVKDIYDKKSGQLSGPIEDILAKLIAGAGGNDMAKKQEELSSTFGSEAGRGMSKLVTQYMDVYGKTVGTEAEKQAAGMRVVSEALSAMKNAAGDWTDVEQDAAQAQQNTSAKLVGAWEAVKANAADKLLPSLAKMAESFSGKESMLDPFIEAVGLAAEAVAWLAEATGFKKKKTKAEVLDEEIRKSDKAAKKALGEGPMTPEKFAEVYGGADKAYKDLYGISEDGGSTAPTTFDDFVQKYQAAGGEGATRAAAEQAAKAAMSGDGMFNNDFFQKNFAGENQAQQELRHQFAGEAAGQKSEAQFDTKAAQDAAIAFAVTVAAVNAKIAAAGGAQGTIVSGV